MATRLEPGQVQLRSSGGVPMQQIVPTGVDYIGPRAQARAAETMAQILDRMSQSTFGLAKEMAQEEAFRFAAENPITEEQLQLAKEGLPQAIPGVGKTAGDYTVYGKARKFSSDYTVYGQALQKARTLQLAGHFEIEGRNELAKLLTEVQNGKADSQSVAAKIATVTDGYAKSLAKIDGEASIKFRATMATHGNTVLNAAYEAELKRVKDQERIKFDMDSDNVGRLIEATVSQQPEMIDQIADVFRKNISTQALLLGDLALQKEYSTKFETMLRNAKIAAVTKHLQSDEYIGDATATLEKLRLRQVGKMSSILNDLFINDMDAYAKVVANFMAADTSRETTAARKREENKRAAEGKAIDLLEQIFPIKDKNNPKRRELIEQLKALPPGSTPIGTLQTLLSPTDEGEGSSQSMYNALDLVFKGVIRSKEDIDRIPGLSIKQKIDLLKLTRKEDKSGDNELFTRVNRLAGVPETSNGGFVIDEKSEQFKKRKRLEARAAQIESDLINQGKPVTKAQVADILEQEVLAQKNSQEAKDARKQLDDYARRADGSFKPDRDWITGPINRNTLPALRQKAGNDPKKLRQIQDIERLLKLSEGS